MRMQTGGGGKGGAFSFGKAAPAYWTKMPTSDFADVADCDEAKEEVQEIVDYLKAPNRYQSLGGRVPRGILLAGSPVRVRRFGESDCRRSLRAVLQHFRFRLCRNVRRCRCKPRPRYVRAGEENAPCIIFIDEIDAVGR